MLDTHCLPVPYSATHIWLVFSLSLGTSSAVCFCVQAGFMYSLLVGGIGRQARKQIDLSHRVSILHRQTAAAAVTSSQSEANKHLQPESGIPQSIGVDLKVSILMSRAGAVADRVIWQTHRNHLTTTDCLP